MVSRWEPSIEPPEQYSVIAGCGHEVWEDEMMYEWDCGGTLCPDCVAAKFDELSIFEKAALVGCVGTPVRTRRIGAWF